MPEVSPQARVDMMANVEKLKENVYPGRGIVLGRSENPDELVQVYWVTGRGDRSRNRILVHDDDIVRTEAYDPSKMDDPSLVIYNAMRSHRETFHYPRLHIVSNGDQTDTVYDLAEKAEHSVMNFDPFKEALFERTFEPDDPNFTPRITGALAIGLVWNRFEYSIIRRNQTTGMPEHMFSRGELDAIPAGLGLCYHTYKGDGDPLPPFEGGPYVVPLGSTALGIATDFWNVMDPDNRVGVVARTFDSHTGEILDTAIHNTLGSC